MSLCVSKLAVSPTAMYTCIVMELKFTIMIRIDIHLILASRSTWHKCGILGPIFLTICKILFLGADDSPDGASLALETISIAIENNNGKPMLFMNLWETFLHLTPPADEHWLRPRSQIWDPSDI